MVCIVGWDIGGVNVKAALLRLECGKPPRVRVVSQPFEIWREKDRLCEVLRSVYAAVAPDLPPQAMAVTMTAELSDVFATKREGVLFVLESVEHCFPEPANYVFSLSGEFVMLREARAQPLDFAASNWLAAAQWVAGRFSNCLVVDVGSTTTDILPILNGRVMAGGRTDMERLACGELVYTGVLRTNLAAIVQSVPIEGRCCPVASEYFAISGDVHLVLGSLDPEKYTCTTPDGQPPSVESARRRLARLVCADAEMLSSTAVDELARYIRMRQIRQIQDGIAKVVSRLPCLRKYPVIVLGTGAFLGAAAARDMGLEIWDPANDWGREETSAAPCVAAAYLLAGHMEAVSHARGPNAST